jgi:hypothetical protein
MVRSKTLLLLIVSTVILGKSYAQSLSFIPRINFRQTIEQGVYKTTFGLGGGGGLRYNINSWIYIQGGWGMDKLALNDVKASRANLQTWDWQICFKPYPDFPIHFYGGTLLHRYNITTNAVLVNDMIFFPSYKVKVKYDGWNMGIGYSLNKWLELRLTYEKEPFALFKVKYTSNFLRLDLVGVLPFYKWEKAKTPVESAQ